MLRVYSSLPERTTTARECGVIAESEDFGCGSMALAVARDITDPQNGSVEVFVGTLTHHARPEAYHATAPPSHIVDMVGSVHMLTYDESRPAGSRLASHGSALVFDTTATQTGSLGVTGLALGDLDGVAGDELVVTTLTGELKIYKVTASGIDTQNPLQETRLEGSLGLHNSIVIEDLDGDGKNELYVAGSQGVWKLKRGS